MKKIRNIFNVILISMLVISICLSYKDNCEIQTAKAAAQLTLSDSQITLGLECNRTLTVKDKRKVTWTSSNEDVAGTSSYNVGETNILAKSVGTTTITATDENGNEATCSVNVIDSYIELDTYDVSMVRTNGGKQIKVLSGNIASVESSNDRIATATYSNQREIIDISDHSPGEAVITVTEKRGATAQIKVKVEEDFMLSKNSLDITIYDDEPVEQKYYIGNISGRIDTIYSVYSDITNVVSNNSNVARIKKSTWNNNETVWEVIPVASGKTTIDCFNKYGKSKSINISVNKIIRPLKLNCSEVAINYYYYEDNADTVISSKKGSGSVYSKGPDITGAVSKNEKIVKLEKSKDNDITYWKMVPVSSGLTTIEVKDNYGQMASFTVKVKKQVRPLSLNENELVLSNHNNSGDIEENRTIGFYPKSSFYNSSGDFVPVNENAEIVSVKSGNLKVVSLTDYCNEKNEFEGWSIIPEGVGTTTIECKDQYGRIATLKVTVTKTYMSGYIKARTHINKIVYADRSITGKTIKNALVSAKLAGKTYKAKANGSGYFKIKIPVKKVGTKVYLTASRNGAKYSTQSRIKKANTSIKCSRVYRNTEKIKIIIKNAKKGDSVTVKASGMKYKKKIKGSRRKFTYVQKIRRVKPGKKISIVVKNKFGQKAGKKKIKVYYASKVKKGMTKAQCKLVPGWEYPDRITVVGDYTYWYYDKASLLFVKGRLYGWSK